MLEKSYSKALVTGAGGDLGGELCRALAAQGIELVVMNRSRDSLLALCEDLQAQGATISPYFVDVTDFEALEQCLVDVQSTHPDIDLLLLNAGVDKPQRIEQFDWRIAKLQVDTNLIANYVFVSKFAPALMQRGGCIAVVSSLASYIGCPYEHAYNASKAGARMLVDGLRAELLETDVKVCGIYPGFIAGRMVDGNAWRVETAVSPTQVAEAICAGLAAGQSEIHFPAQDHALVQQLSALGPEERAAAVRQAMLP